MEAVLLAVAGVVALLTLGALASRGPRAIFWLGFVATLVPLGYIDRYYFDLPSSIKWLPEITLVFAAVAALVLVPGTRLHAPRAVLWVYAAIVAEALLSLAFNRTSAVALVVSQRGYVLLFAALLVMNAVRGIYAKEELYAALVGGGIVSAVVCLLQRLTLAAGEADRVTGLFSLGEVVLFYHLVCIGIVLAYWVEGRRVGRWNAGLAVGLLTLSVAVGNQEAALPYFLLLLGYLLLRARARRGALLGLTLALPLAMLGIFTVLYDSAYTSRSGSFSKSIFDADYVKRYLFGEKDDLYTPGGDLLRGAAIQGAYREVAGDTAHLLVGRGPGVTTESGVAGASGALAAQYPGIGRVTLSMLVGDTGVLGVLLYVALLLAILRSRPPAAAREPHEHLLVRELVVLLAFGYFIYARLTYEPCYAWILASLLPASPRRDGDALAGSPVA